MSCEARPIEECATLERVNFILRYDPEESDHIVLPDRVVRQIETQLQGEAQ
jgi:hypothetical protein